MDLGGAPGARASGACALGARAPHFSVTVKWLHSISTEALGPQLHGIVCQQCLAE